MLESPFVLVIFGATGDLAKHKLIPGLFGLFKAGQLPESFYVVGFARRPFKDSEFADMFVKDDPKWQEFAKHLYYQQGLFDEDKGYVELIDKLKGFDEKMGACITRVFYLATPPSNYESILDNLTATKLSEGCGQGSSKWTRVAIEKPFGKDLETAKALDKKLSEMFEERQIFRVDHYLGKETVQNMLVFRFANGIFEPIWNKDFVDHVQITHAEEKTIGDRNRGKFFDGVGALRDVAQNHLLQLLTSVAMEMPKSFSKEGVRDARAKAMSTLQCIEPSKVTQNVVRAQYKGYKSDKDVNPDSQTETFAAMKFFMDSPRWQGVPFYMRSGVGLPKDVVEISLVFKQTCHILFKEIGCPEEGNILTIRVQPDAGITLKIIAKKPGSTLALEDVNMHFTYTEQFGTQGLDAYEKVLLDIFMGDQTLFNRSDELEYSWTFIEKILKGWEESDAPVYEYEKGTWGPQAAQELIEKDGRKWI